MRGVHAQMRASHPRFVQLIRVIASDPFAPDLRPTHGVCKRTRWIRAIHALRQHPSSGVAVYYLVFSTITQAAFAFYRSLSIQVILDAFP